MKVHVSLLAHQVIIKTLSLRLVMYVQMNVKLALMQIHVILVLLTQHNISYTKNSVLRHAQITIIQIPILENAKNVLAVVRNAMVQMRMTAIPVRPIKSWTLMITELIQK